MRTKALEIRDRMTFIPMLCVDMNPGMSYDFTAAQQGCERYLLRRCGYNCNGVPNVIMTRLDGSGKATNDPYGWSDRTFTVAHNYIIEHWNELHDGDVIDVEFILGETATKKISERLES